MNILNKSNVNILDLPDEMLRAIFNKLNMINVLYSLVDVNLRFDRLVLDSLYIHHLDFVIKRDYIHNQSKDTYFLDRICNKVLPRIRVHGEFEFAANSKFLYRLYRLYRYSVEGKLILIAVNHHQVLITEASEYQGCGRHLFGLSIIAYLAGKLSELTNNPS
ncbi:unnamed protein product [Rotaria sp. Silwood2]|nr:unnamed protein product [Rotaria sp. Silwood2]CAF4008555.1 unnamed protein product [Rotaria sp. Silwood2]